MASYVGENHREWDKWLAEFRFALNNAKHFQADDLVWVKAHPVSKVSEYYSSKLAPRWSGPARLKSKLGPINYRVKWIQPNDKEETVNIVNLKPFWGNLPEQPLAGGQGRGRGLRGDSVTWPQNREIVFISDIPIISNIANNAVIIVCLYFVMVIYICILF